MTALALPAGGLELTQSVCYEPQHGLEVTGALGLKPWTETRDGLTGRGIATKLKLAYHRAGETKTVSGIVVERIFGELESVCDWLLSPALDSALHGLMESEIRGVQNLKGRAGTIKILQAFTTEIEQRCRPSR